MCDASPPQLDLAVGESVRKRFLGFLSGALRKQGRFEGFLKVTRLRGRDTKVVHQVVIPYATYSPWWTDTGFQEVFKRVRDNTLLDLYRLYDLWHLTGQMRGVDGDILEVGVWRGGSGCLMAARAQRDGFDATVYLCDNFEGVVKAGGKDTEYSGGEHADTSADTVEQLVTAMGLQHVKVVPGIFPDESEDRVPVERLRLCHIDVDTYESAADVLAWVWPRLVRGGLVVFDDYAFYSTEGITRLVNEQGERTDLLMVHNLNGHGLLVKR